MVTSAITGVHLLVLGGARLQFIREPRIERQFYLPVNLKRNIQQSTYITTLQHYSTSIVFD